MIEHITCPQVAEPPPAMWSNCLKAGDHVYLSGLTARDADLQATGGDEYAQSCRIFERMSHLMRAAGGSLRDIVKLNIYLTRIANRESFWRARREFFDGAFPAATLVEVSALAQPEILVEIEAVGLLRHGGRPAASMEGAQP